MDKNKIRIVFYISVFAVAVAINIIKEIFQIRLLSIIVTLITGSASLAAVAFALYELIETYFESKSKKICYVSNNTTFSNRIYDGIVYSELNTSYFISRKIIGRNISELIRFMQEDAYKYRGLIIRYKFKKGESYNEFSELVKQYLKKGDNSIVFVDTNVKDLNIKDLKNWSIVNSDLTIGGIIVAEEIKRICRKYNNPYIFIIDGPNNDPNVSRRLEEIKSDKYITNAENKHIMYVEKLKKETVFKEFVSTINNSIKANAIKEKNVDAIVMFCGNDQLTYDFMRTLNMRQNKHPDIKKYFTELCGNNYNNLYLIGYDGLKDIDSPINDSNDYAYKLEAFTNEFNYFSVDAKPYEQGEKSIDTLHRLIGHNHMNSKKEVEINPTTYQSQLWPKKDTEQTYVFDLDGTLANTEQLHLDAYNIVLKPFNVSISAEEFSDYIGKTEETIHEEIKRKHNINYDTEEMTNTRLETYKQLINKPDSLFVPKELLRIIKNPSYKKYILSSQRRDIIDFVLDKLNINNSFEKIVSCKDQTYSKIDVLNNPTDYFNTSNITVCEDSVPILDLAKEKGYKTVGVIHSINKKLFIEDKYDVVIKDFLS